MKTVADTCNLSLLFSKNTSVDEWVSDLFTGNMILTEKSHEIVSFRQPAYKDHLEKAGGQMIEDPLQEKVAILVTLCGILCDRDAATASSRAELQQYAVTYLIRHLQDIDVKKASPRQGRDVVEALSRVLSNDNDVCSVFEGISARMNLYWPNIDLYDVFSLENLAEHETISALLGWAKKMNFYDDQELSNRAREWVISMIRTPQSMLEALGRGHLENLAQKVTVKDATFPYLLAHRALFTVRTWLCSFRPCTLTNASDRII